MLRGLTGCLFKNDTIVFALQVLLLLCNLCYPVVLPAHLSQHAKVATCTADGLTSSDPIHKKSAGNLSIFANPEKLQFLTGKLISRTITLASSWSQWYLLGIKLIPFFRSGSLKSNKLMPSSSALIPMSICRLQCLFSHSFTAYEWLNRDCDAQIYIGIMSRWTGYKYLWKVYTQKSQKNIPFTIFNGVPTMFTCIARCR
jgi:hypothetical protein